MTLLKELIDIPEHVDRGQFVLKLAQGVTAPEATVNSYVATPQLVRCFEDALNFIQGAVEANTSKATYLHGSFGSGKSHFMAVLHLILQGNPAAKGIPELAAAVQKHNGWISGKKFLLVPYHMIGAHDVESGILGGYVDFIRRNHPEEPLPGVYLAEGLFRDAQKLRERMGDDAFFAALSEGASGSSGGWGDVAAGWDAERFENAIEADPGDEERSLLIGVLVDKFFGAYDTQASGRGEAFLSLDKGLSVISRHAKSLGYDGLILFLDELILWLASHAADLSFVHQEGQKLAKLVEAQTADRPVPIISFIARQRDLSELIGDTVPGANRVNFSDALKHWEGRFHKITLEDRNLPAIAEKRVLRRKSDTAARELDAAFEQTTKIRESVMSTLLTSEGDREMFRKVYPFSPALVRTLIAVSSVLQRERTALKVMMQLLVDQREHLEVGDIVPVGDLFDVIAHGDEAFSQDMAIHFDNAKRLYHRKLLPMLEKQHAPVEELEKLPYDDSRREAFRDDDRLIKTLLLAALVPEVETLAGLTAERLAALNHGTIRTPIPGREAQEVLRRCRAWAASGDIRIGEEANPTISVHLSGVDTDTIIKQAEREDNTGNRVRLVRELLFAELGIEEAGEYEHYYDFLWKNTKRSCTVLFKNIRELSDASLENDEHDNWKLVIDFPFDEAGHGPKDDLSKLQAFQESHPGGAKTLCWVPQFFSDDARKDLGLLVILEHILKGERFSQYSSHLSAQDRQSAKSQLGHQRSVLRQRVKSHLEAAYGLDTIIPGSLDTTHELEPHEQFVSLRNGFDPRVPAAAHLNGAMVELLSQALASEFPGAPDFGAEIKYSNVRKVHEVVVEAIQSSDGRVLVDRPLRPLMRHIANPLRLGEMGDDATHFVLGQHWHNHFTKKKAETGGTLRVDNLREWIDDPRPMGLPKEVENLIILAFADQTNCNVTRHGGPWEGTLKNVPDDCELKTWKGPTQEHWETARDRANTIFGITSSPLLKAGNVEALSSVVKQRAAEQRHSCQGYSQRLKARCQQFGLDPEGADRARTALATHSLLETLNSRETDEVVAALAVAEVATSPSAMGACLSNAGEWNGTLESTNWEIFDAIRRLGGEFQRRADAIHDKVRQALSEDEHVIALTPALTEAQSQALRLITEAAKPEEKPSDVRDEPKQDGSDLSQTPDSPKVVERDSATGLDLPAALDELDKVKQLLRDGRKARIDIHWVVEEAGGDS